MQTKDRLLLEAFLNHSFNGTLSSKTESLLDRYLQAKVSVESAENLEAYDYFSLTTGLV
jgi:hypothetical protein